MAINPCIEIVVYEQIFNIPPFDALAVLGLRSGC